MSLQEDGPARGNECKGLGGGGDGGGTGVSFVCQEKIQSLSGRAGAGAGAGVERSLPRPVS